MDCTECEKDYGGETHHCVFRSQSKIMINMDLNKKRLCTKCHKGDNGPHKNREKDLEYKLEVQNQLKNILCNDYYTLEGLKKSLKLKESQVKYIIKNVLHTPKGYQSEEVIRYMMGGRIYEL